METWPSLKHKWITWLSPSLARLYDHRNPQRHDSPQRGFPIIVPYFDYFVYGRQIGYKFINIFLDLKGLFIEDSLLRRSSRWVFHSFFSLTSLPTTQRSLWRGEERVSKMNVSLTDSISMYTVSILWLLLEWSFIIWDPTWRLCRPAQNKQKYICYTLLLLQISGSQ